MHSPDVVLRLCPTRDRLVDIYAMGFIEDCCSLRTGRMNFHKDDIAERAAIWILLSDLFLDTDVSLSYEYIARECAASRFSLLKLEEILVRDVAPVCAGNLLSVAGEWAGFDEQWLIQEITRSREKNNCWQRFTKSLLSYAFRGYIQEHWQKIAPMILSQRNNES
jgi:hypothetical protein